MAREYFPKYCEVPRDVYDEVKAVLRGYDRLRREQMDIIYGSPSSDGTPHGSTPGDPTAQKAIKLSYIDGRLEAIDQTAFMLKAWLGDKVPESFDPIKAFWSYDYYNYMHIRRDADDNGPVRKTWTRYRYRFAGEAARRLKLF